jgi:outer membrane lipoprotein SlyB
MKKITTALTALVAAASLAACSGEMHMGQSDHWQFGHPVNASAERNVQIEYGKLLASQVIRMPDNGSAAAAGAVGGALIGGALGNAIMHGKARKNGMMAGAALGALSGASGAAEANNYKTVEYTVAKEGGPTVLIDQNVLPSEPVIVPGRRVMIQTSAGVTRVVPAVD